MSLMVSISGVRGFIGETLTPDIVVKYSSAFADYCKRGAIVIERDAIAEIALVLQQLVEFDGTLSGLRSSLPQYPIVKSTIEVKNVGIDRVLANIRNQYDGKCDVNTDDGLRLDFADEWVHLRKSNTEPIIRIIAEAHAVDRAQQLVKEFREKIS